MNKIELIYLDLDGVVFGFEELYTKWFGITPEETRATGNKKLFHKNFDEFIARRGFEKLEMLEDAHILLDYLDYAEIPVEILTACGGARRIEAAKEQKTIAVCDNVCHWLDVRAMNFAVNSKEKVKWAAPNALLIDDKPSNVLEFAQSGGHAIRHTSAVSTIQQLQYYYGLPK